jgi:PPK2 family polyphosphate:nucleotide phosphotransferase
MLKVDIKKLDKALSHFYVQPGKKIKLKDFKTDYDHGKLTKVEGQKMLELGLENLARLQDKLYAHNQYSLLIVLQAMDAAGKDGAIKHVLSGFNPSGVKVASFKAPNSTELDHDYFWRHSRELPARGEIGIFNRSHYENVLVTRVHPEFILKENLPHVQSLKDINKNFWKARYAQINRFEKNLVENGTIILKIFLHVSKAEQKKRFLDRIDDPTKNWKFSHADLKERAYWDDYQKAFEEMLESTSTEYAPWMVLPADDKWFTRLAFAACIFSAFEKLNLEYPVVSKEQKDELQKAKQQLLSEK